MPDQITETEYIPPVRVAEFPPGSLCLQSPEGWAYYINDGRENFLTPNQQPVSAYIDEVKRDYEGRLWFHYPPGSYNAVYVDKLPVWRWVEGSTNLDARHFRPPVVTPGATLPPYVDQEKVAESILEPVPEQKPATLDDLLAELRAIREEVFAIGHSLETVEEIKEKLHDNPP